MKATRAAEPWSLLSCPEYLCACAVESNRRRRAAANHAAGDYCCPGLALRRVCRRRRVFRERRRLIRDDRVDLRLLVGRERSSGYALHEAEQLLDQRLFFRLVVPDIVESCHESVYLSFDPRE